MATVFPSDVIDQMKEAEVNEHLMRLVSMEEEAFKNLVARNIENGAIFKQVLNSETVDFRNAFAAGLISEAEADYLNGIKKAMDGADSEPEPEPEPDPEPDPETPTE